jgi:hypothetical protein
VTSANTRLTHARSWSARIGVALIALALSVGLTGCGGGSHDANPPNLLTADGLTYLFGQMRTKYGDTTGYRLSVETNHAELIRPDPGNAHKTKQFRFIRNEWQDWDETETVPNSFAGGADGLGDLSKFNAQAVLGVFGKAPQTLHVDSPANTYIVIDSAKSGHLDLSIFAVGEDKKVGYMIVDSNGIVGKTFPVPS